MPCVPAPSLTSPEKPVIIESGPLSVEPASVEPDSEAEDFEEDENEILSAKDLLSRPTSEVYEGDEDEYYYWKKNINLLILCVLFSL